jgi:diketogulonate reductase-like aldo/keto reductase
MIVKTDKISHLKENTGALGWKLLEEDLRQIREVFGYFAD